MTAGSRHNRHRGGREREFETEVNRREFTSPRYVQGADEDSIVDLIANHHMAAPRRRGVLEFLGAPPILHQPRGRKRQHRGDGAPQQHQITHALRLLLRRLRLQHAILHHHSLLPHRTAPRRVILVAAAAVALSALALGSHSGSIVLAVTIATGTAARQPAHQLVLDADLLARAVLVHFARRHTARNGNAAIAIAAALEAGVALLIAVLTTAHFGVFLENRIAILVVLDIAVSVEAEALLIGLERREAHRSVRRKRRAAPRRGAVGGVVIVSIAAVALSALARCAPARVIAVLAIAITAARTSAGQSAHQRVLLANLLARTVVIHFAARNTALDGNASITAAAALEALVTLLIGILTAAHFHRGLHSDL